MSRPFRILPLLLPIAVLGGCHFNVSAIAEVDSSPDAGRNADEAPDAGLMADDPATPSATHLDASMARSPDDAGGREEVPARTAASAGACAPDLPAGGRDVTVSADNGLVELARWQAPSLQDRALGPVVRFGSRRAWILTTRFSEINPPQVPVGTPINQPIAAWDAADDIRWMTEGPSPTAEPLLTLLADEVPGTAGIEPISLIARDHEHGGLLLGLRYTLGKFEGTWVADLAEDGLSASNRRNLFGPNDPMFIYGAIRTRDHLMVYACDPIKLASACFAGRVPNGQEDRRSAYEVRTQDEHGNWTWTSDLHRGTALFKDVDKDLSVFFSPYLQRYVAVHGAARLPGRAFLVLHTAAAPEGPWTEQFALLLPQTPAWWPTRVRVHEALSDPCGKRLIVSYFYGTRAANDDIRFPIAGETVVGEIELTRH